MAKHKYLFMKLNLSWPSIIPPVFLLGEFEFLDGDDEL